MSFVVPTTQIKSPEDLQDYLASPQCEDVLNFLQELNSSVLGKSNSAPCVESPIIGKIVKILNQLSTWVDEIAPVSQPMRYGNTAYRTWFDRLSQNATNLMLEILPEELSDASVELGVYLRESFGNRVRIDYGTGHETCFAAWMYCVKKLKLVTDEDNQALVTRVFVKYLEVTRKVQCTYYLEPAGSHGVWSLDDYQFLPFYWGAAQLVGHPHIKTRSILNKEILEAYSHEYLYLNAIAFIHRMKTGPFSEHSPILYDISGVDAWEKVNMGMLKMYKVEVIGKFPIMQHFLFGSIIKFKDSNQPQPSL